MFIYTIKDIIGLLVIVGVILYFLVLLIICKIDDYKRKRRKR